MPNMKRKRLGKLTYLLQSLAKGNICRANEALKFTFSPAKATYNRPMPRWFYCNTDTNPLPFCLSSVRLIANSADILLPCEFSLIAD